MAVESVGRAEPDATSKSETPEITTEERQRQAAMVLMGGELAFEMIEEEEENERG